VLCWSPGSLSTHVRIDARYCIKLPDALPFDEAVALSTAHATMVRGLVELCSLAQGESVLIHSAASPEGIAAIQIARMVGAKVWKFPLVFQTANANWFLQIFATAATEEQKALLETKNGIPRSHIFSSSDDSFVHGILQSTNARGVDVVVNILSDDLFYESWKCIAEGGSMLDLSQRDSTSHGKPDRGLLGGNRSLYSFDIVTLLQQKPSMAQRSVEHHLPIFP